MKVSELINKLQAYNKEIGCDGKGINSHPEYPSRVRFVIDNDDTELGFYLDADLTEIEMDYRIGCMCPEGIVFHLKVTK